MGKKSDSLALLLLMLSFLCFFFSIFITSSRGEELGMVWWWDTTVWWSPLPTLCPLIGAGSAMLAMTKFEPFGSTRDPMMFDKWPINVLIIALTILNSIFFWKMIRTAF